MAQTRHVCWLLMSYRLIGKKCWKGSEKQKKHCELTFKNWGARESGRWGVTELGGGWFYYIINMGNSVTVLAAYQSTWLVKILSVTQVIWCLHTCMHARAHTQTHTHTHVYICIHLKVLLCLFFISIFNNTHTYSCENCSTLLLFKLIFQLNS